MTERDLLERIDAHLARIDAHLAHSGELMVRIDGHLARSEVLMDQIREEMRLTREEVQRSRERAARNAELEDTRAFTTSLMARFDRWMRDLTRDMHERRDENRATTQALLSILDRLEPGGATG